MEQVYQSLVSLQNEADGYLPADASKAKAMEQEVVTTCSGASLADLKAVLKAFGSYRSPTSKGEAVGYLKRIVLKNYLARVSIQY